jgi:dGTP triphosphohydrolase
MEQLSWADKSAQWNERAYDYAAPHKDDEDSAEAELIKALQSTPAFKRLSDIRFLGALDYFLVSQPNGAPTNSRYTRAQHSLGVARLSQTYLALRNHTVEDRLLCVAAAMLHDIGHPPFSHTSEPVFCELFALDHHVASEQIIRGEEPLGQGISQALARFGISPQAVIDVLNGTADPFEGFFSGPINFDTVEGILRCRHYLKMGNMGITPVRVVEAASNREGDLSREIVDGFWACKHEVYNLMIRSRPGVLCDLLFQEIMRRSSCDLERSDFFATEAQVFKKIPLLREVLRKDRVLNIAYSVLPKNVHYQARTFFVNRVAAFSSQADKQRYRQTKIPLTLTLEEFLPA